MATARHRNICRHHLAVPYEHDGPLEFMVSKGQRLGRGHVFWRACHGRYRMAIRRSRPRTADRSIAYRFLMQTYEDDDIFIFGFSRGAYVARFLAEMLDHVGLLSAGNEEMARFAWKAFARWQERQDGTEKEAQRKKEMFLYMKSFRETFSRPVRRIRFMGLFDTGRPCIRRGGNHGLTDEQSTASPASRMPGCSEASSRIPSGALPR